jgi:hypothetical protein
VVATDAAVCTGQAGLAEKKHFPFIISHLSLIIF